MRTVLGSPWGRLFRNWETLTPDADGFPRSDTAFEVKLSGAKALVRRSASWAPASRRRRNSSLERLAGIEGRSKEPLIYE